MAIGASRRTIVPFAIDLRDDGRWVAFTPSLRIRPPAFSLGFGIVLNKAVEKLKLIPAEWEVDPVTSRSRVEVWLQENPEVTKFVRIVLFHNPRRDIGEERQEMRALAAKYKREEFVAPANDALELQGNEEFENKLEGLETGDIEIELHARGPGKAKPRFKSREMVDETYIDDFGDDYERGMSLVLDVLRDYAEGKR